MRTAIADDGSLKDYQELKAQFSRAEFVEHFNFPFLVFDWSDIEEDEEDFDFNTMCLPQEQANRLMRKALVRTASSKLIRLVKKGANVFEGMINVGRAGNCDIVIDAASVSKFHAYFAKDGTDGQHYVCDANSTNGTYVNGERVAPHEKKALTDGDTVSFGRHAHLSFHTAEGCHDLLEKIPG